MYYPMIQTYGYAQSNNFIGAAEYDKLLLILVAITEQGYIPQYPYS